MAVRRVTWILVAGVAAAALPAVLIAGLWASRGSDDMDTGTRLVASLVFLTFFVLFYGPAILRLIRDVPAGFVGRTSAMIVAIIAIATGGAILLAVSSVAELSPVPLMVAGGLMWLLAGSVTAR